MFVLEFDTTGDDDVIPSTSKGYDDDKDESCCCCLGIQIKLIKKWEFVLMERNFRAA